MRRLLPCLLALVACDEAKDGPKEKPPSRFQAVATSPAAEKAASSFCERSFPATGAEARRWSTPPSRPMPRAPKRASEVTASKPGTGWRWINLWASWCVPCIEELPLLERWRSTLNKEGLAVHLELWSIDEEEAAFAGALDRSFPGEVFWLRSEADLPVVLEQLGVDKSSAIPIHALVDPAGMLRCVRVGSVGENAYGAVKTILAGG